MADQASPESQPPPPPSQTAVTAEPRPQNPPTNPAKRTYSKPPTRTRKVWDPLLDGWYFNEVNKRDNEYAGVFKNYQINPYTKKTLQYVTPKITERRPPLPDDCKQNLTPEEQQLLDSFHTVKRFMDKSVDVPKCKYCAPETELMRLGWWPAPPPPVKARTCMFILTPWNKDPCCYYYPTPAQDQMQNENYDERFRATHQTAEFIKCETMLKKFDSIMNPDGYRGQVKTPRIKPGSRSKMNK